MDSFVAIDFETASYNTACAIGLVHFENGEVIDERYTLINPQIPARAWQRYAIRVHGITPSDVIDAPTFADIWPEMIHYAACYPLIAHNAEFDIGVLRGELARGRLQSPIIRYGCSLALAKTAWPKRRFTDVEEAGEGELRPVPQNHRLSTLSEFLGIELQHHNALSDARASGMITVKAVEQLGHNTLASAYERRHRWGEMAPPPMPVSAYGPV